MNKIQNLYEKIQPTEAPETIVERIIARSEAEKNSAKTRRPGRLAVAACIAVVLIAVVPATASAVIGTNIFDIFKSYFHTQELDPVGMVEYHKVIEAGGKGTGQDGEAIESSEYRLTINGLAADQHTVYISYDIEYKDPSYFENGELRQEVKEWSPFSFYAEPQTAYGTGTGGVTCGIPVSVDGATVSYVGFASWSDSFLERPSMDKYYIKIKYSCGSVDSDGNFSWPEEDDGVFYVSIPATKDITLTVKEEITCPDGGEGILSKIELNSLSVYIYVTTGYEQRYNAEQYAPKLIFKDGTVLDLSVKPVGGAGSHQLGQDFKWNYYYLYGTAIDPETIEAVEILGKTYAVEDFREERREENRK